MNPNPALAFLCNEKLLCATREILRRGCVVEADLLLHLAEIEERRLHLEMACPTMFAFCVMKLGFSEDATYNRLGVARAAKQFPAILAALRSGDVHLSGLRVLVPRLDAGNHHEILARARGKSKREIEELVAALAPKPPVQDAMRKLPKPAAQLALEPGSAAARRVEQPRAIAPLSEDTFRVRFTASRRLRDKLGQAQDLLRHRLPSGDLAAIVESAVDLLIEKVKKERFGVGRKPSTTAATKSATCCARPIPAATRRVVYLRDEGRCTFVDKFGNRCPETGMLEYDHLDGWARTHTHDPDRIVVRCHAHNQHAAEKMYGSEFMERARTSREAGGRPGADCDSSSPTTDAIGAHGRVAGGPP